MTRLITGTYLAQTKAPSRQENPANAESTKNLNNGTRFNPDFRFSVMRDGLRLIRNLGTTAALRPHCKDVVDTTRAGLELQANRNLGVVPRSLRHSETVDTSPTSLIPLTLRTGLTGIYDINLMLVEIRLSPPALEEG